MKDEYKIKKQLIGELVELRKEIDRLRKSIPERKRKNSVLRESEEKFRGIYEESPIGIKIYDSDGSLIDANKAFLDMFGVSDISEIMQLRLFEDHNMSDEAKESLRRGEMVEYTAPFDFRNVKADDLYRTTRSGVIYTDVLMTPLRRDGVESPYGYLVQVQDITERKQAEEALRASQGYANNIIASSLNMIIAVDNKRRIREFNKAAEKAFGYSKKEVIGKHVGILYADKKEVEVVHSKTVKHGQLILEILNRRKNGDVFPSLLSAFVLRDAAEKRVGVMGVSLDITKRKRAEEDLKREHRMLTHTNEELTRILKQEADLKEQLINAERLASLGTMATKIAHEINNPLTVIKGHAQMQAQLVSDPSIKESFAVIEQKAVQVEKLTRGYMNLARPTEMKMDNIKLGDILHETLTSLKPLGQLKHIDLVETYINAEPEVLGNPESLEQVFRNLIINAVDATSGQVHRKITAGTVLTQNNKIVDAFVSDNGIGIAPEDLEKIFTQYYTKKERESGSGLGLVIAREIAQIMHGGRLTVESQLGVGSKFHVIIPLEKYSRLKKKILIADDDASITGVLAQFFTNKGLIVHTADNGKSALRSYKKHKQDVVLSDIVMPKMDGIELINKILDIKPDQPIVMMTGFDSNVDFASSIKEKGIELIYKPPDFEGELWKTIEECLGPF